MEENQKNMDERVNEILRSPSYRMAYRDADFLSEPDCRPVRMQLELLKPEMRFEEYQIRSTIVAFGSARIREESAARRMLDAAQANAQERPDDPAAGKEVQRWRHLLGLSKYYDQAREFAKIVSECGQREEPYDYVICTGGGPGIMEAANRGAHDVGGKSIGLNISLPHEQNPNPYITPELCFKFHYFAMRKMHFLLRAKALVAFPGGFGTFDELFQTLTLRQTGKMQEIPIILYGTEFWNSVVDFEGLVERGVIAESDLDLFSFADEPRLAWETIQRYHNECTL